MAKCVNLSLFESNDAKVISCIKMAKFLDERFTRNKELKEMIKSDKMQDIKKILSEDIDKTNGDNAPQKRLEENSKAKQKKEPKRIEGTTERKYHVSEFVYLSRNDYKSLLKNYNDKQGIRWAILQLDAYLDRTPKARTKYVDHRSVLRAGNWIHDKYVENKNKQNYYKPSTNQGSDRKARMEYEKKQLEEQGV